MEPAGADRYDDRSMTPEKKTMAPLEKEFLRLALSLASKREVNFILLISDQPLSAELLKGKLVKNKLVYAVSSERLMEERIESGARAVSLPPYEYGRMEMVKVAVISGLAAGILKEGQTVLALAGRDSSIDTLVKLKIGAGFDDRVNIDALELTEEFSSQSMEAFLDIALRIGHDGFEGHPIGTLITIGDATNVMERSRQLTINPFQGISESERNVLDPRIREAVQNFSILDGAFVAREDGVIMAAGRYLQAHTAEVRVPLGLGARHTAAAAITLETSAIAITVSQTSGSVRVFQNGKIVLELHQPSRRP